LKQSELKAILKDHKLWSDSSGSKGKRASLQGANLCNANLTDANLCNANLTDANLRGANLIDASLQDANLQDANLQDADFSDANLRDANLQDANLQDADFSDANLRDAKFTTNFKKVRWFYGATFSEDQIPWVALSPKYPKWAHTLKWVKAKQLSA